MKTNSRPNSKNPRSLSIWSPAKLVHGTGFLFHPSGQASSAANDTLFCEGIHSQPTQASGFQKVRRPHAELRFCKAWLCPKLTDCPDPELFFEHRGPLVQSLQSLCGVVRRFCFQHQQFDCVVCCFLASMLVAHEEEHHQTATSHYQRSTWNVELGHKHQVGSKQKSKMWDSPFFHEHRLSQKLIISSGDRHSKRPVSSFRALRAWRVHLNTSNSGFILQQIKMKSIIFACKGTFKTVSKKKKKKMSE